MIAGLVVLGGSAGKTPAFDADFSSNQSGLFTFASAMNGAGGEVAIDWTWDSSSHVQQTGSQVNIPPAPRTTDSSTLVAKLALNGTVTGARPGATATLFPTVAALSEPTVLRVDAWANYAGNAGGTAGATRLVVIGVADGTSPAPSNFADGTFNGAFYALSVEYGLGATPDPHRYYEGIAGPGLATTVANYFGVNASALGDAEWQGLFAGPTYQSPGAMGKAWTTLELLVDPAADLIELSIIPAGESTPVLVSSRTLPGISTARPFVGTLDLGSAGVATTPGDNFLLVDNVFVGAPGPVTAVGDWMILEY